jgi:hypothetical protein
MSHALTFSLSFENKKKSTPFQSWLLYVDASTPHVDKTFDVTLRCGHGARKQFDWLNASPLTRTFTVDSSDKDAVQVRHR